VPLIAVRTPDPASTIRALVGALNGDADTVPLLQWDVLTGLTGIKPTGEACGQQKRTAAENPQEAALGFVTRRFSAAVRFCCRKLPRLVDAG